jgi:hypothetical protein
MTYLSTAIFVFINGDDLIGRSCSWWLHVRKLEQWAVCGRTSPRHLARPAKTCTFAAAIESGRDSTLAPYGGVLALAAVSHDRSSQRPETRSGVERSIVCSESAIGTHRPLV